MYGGKLVRKLLNPWNFIDVSLLTDRREIAKTLDRSDEIRVLLGDALNSLDKLATRIQIENFMRIALTIAHAKTTKSQISKEAAAEEAIEAASKHPELFKFRLSFNFNYDSSEPKETLSMFGRLLLQSIGTESPYRVLKTGWETFKFSKKARRKS
jgi:lipopolysaccharide biosynthesis regulator YciM